MTTPDSDSGPPAAPSILVADDHDLVRIGMIQLLRHWNPAVVVGEAANGPALERLLAGAHPLGSPAAGPRDARIRWGSAARTLMERHPSLPVLVVSGTGDAAATARLLDAGVAGFLPKSLDGGLMVKAIELVLAGGRYVPPDVLRGLPPTAGPAAFADASDGSDITPRQREILALLLQGLPNKVIAARLAIAEATVKIARDGTPARARRVLARRTPRQAALTAARVRTRDRAAQPLAGQFRPACTAPGNPRPAAPADRRARCRR